MLKIFALVVLCAAVAFADDKSAEPPKSPAAVTAAREHDVAIEAAEKAFHDAKIAAEKKLLDKLRAPLIAATKAGDLDETNRISAAMKAAQNRIEEDSQVKDVRVTYMLWQISMPPDEPLQAWLLSDGRARKPGRHGKWTQEGHTIKIKWDNYKHSEILIVSPDGKTMSGHGSKGNPMTAVLVGTNVTGAEAPPE